MSASSEAEGIPYAAPQPPFWKTALIAVLAIQTVGFIVGGVFGPEPGGWYFQLEKPAVNPPAWVFPVAWTLLYTMMGIAIARVWRARAAPGRRAALTLFGIQLALNYAWSVVFFGLQALPAAVIATVMLLAAAMAATAAMARVDRIAGALMLPYCLWVGFALYLTAWIAAANP